MEAPTLPFAAVASAHELELLSEVSLASGNASEIARRILRRLPAEPGRRSYAYENGFSFHFLTEGRLIFLCMERGVPPPKAFAFLAEMQQSWRTQFAGTRGSSSFKDFDLVLGDLRAAAERGVQGDDDLGMVHDKLQATKAVMSDSIEKVLERGEKIERQQGQSGPPGSLVITALAAWCPSSAPAAPQAAPGGSGRLGTPRVEARPLGALPLPPMLELAASKVADFTAFDRLGSSACSSARRAPPSKM